MKDSPQNILHYAKFKIIKSVVTYLISSLIMLTNTYNIHGQNMRQTSLYQHDVYPEYKADLVHTKLALKFSYKKRQVEGKAWLTMRSHRLSSDSVILDAKGMYVQSVLILKKNKSFSLKYIYDDKKIRIKLDKSYGKMTPFTIFISYMTKPQQSDNIFQEGIHFINPDETDITKPREIWTMGEPNYNSNWFPTIEDPSQKSTSEISLTVSNVDVTLSNGILKSQKQHPNGTRTDTWEMNLPHSPYLFMVAIGKFHITKEIWHRKEISYYVEPRYADYSKFLFRETKEQLSFFSKLFGIEYPWGKYAQIRLANFYGGQENTTATEFNEDGKGSRLEIEDRDFDPTIVHELSHQWFGNYVTCKNWSNLALNESFAKFSEILWAEYKYGYNVADDQLLGDRKAYLDDSSAWAKELIRKNYIRSEEMFDVVTYQKGACILYMLRNIMGNDAFYKGLNIYLNKFKFNSAVSEDLRLSLEKAFGSDLKWFFNQWFYRSGHPILNINYSWNDSLKKESVSISQSQKGDIFILPIYIDLYSAGKIDHRPVILQNAVDTFDFQLPSRPELVNVDANKILLAKITDNKTISEYYFQYANAPLFLDRYEAIIAAITNMNDSISQIIILKALEDKYYGLRLIAMRAIDKKYETLYSLALPKILLIAEKDTNMEVRSEAIDFLGELSNKIYYTIFKNSSVESRSYLVRASALDALFKISPQEAYQISKHYANNSKGKLQQVINDIYATLGDDSLWLYLNYQYADPSSPLQYTFTIKFADYISRLKNPIYAQIGVQEIVDFMYKSNQVDKGLIFIGLLNKIKSSRLEMSDKATAKLIDLEISKINNSLKSNKNSK